MSWNDESTGETGQNGGLSNVDKQSKTNAELGNVNQRCNVASWATRINRGNAVHCSPSGGKNLNRAKYLSENNNEYSYDSLTAENNARKNGCIDNEEHMSVSQVTNENESFCDCGGRDYSSQNGGVSSQELEASSQDLAESSDSFSSHTNRPTVRSVGKGSTSEDTLGTDTIRRDSKGFQHRFGCPMFDKSIQTSHQLATSSSKVSCLSFSCSSY